MGAATGVDDGGAATGEETGAGALVPDRGVAPAYRGGPGIT